MRDDVIAIGVLVLIVGVVAYAYPQTETVLGYTYTAGYPYRDLGTALIVLGIIALIVGAAMGKEGLAIPSPPRVPGTASPNSSRYCASCGQMLRPSDVFCSRCGQKAA